MVVLKTAILDFGSARIKLLSASQNEEGKIEYQKYSTETGLGRMLSSEADVNVIETYQNRLRKDLRFLLDHLEEDVVIKAVATEAFRNNANLAMVLKEFEDKIGEVEILTSQKEAQTFWEGMKLRLNDPELTDTVLVDIGGGSVQIIWQEDEEIVFRSYPIGTYSLENMFNVAGKPLNDVDLSAMKIYIIELLKKTISPKCGISKIIIGSNFMEDFFVTVLGKLGISLDQGCGCKSFGKADALVLQEKIKGLDYVVAGELYPKNPMLMMGIDKSLVIIRAISEIFNCEKIIPTDESISTALIAVMLKSQKSKGNRNDV